MPSHRTELHGISHSQNARAARFYSAFDQKTAQRQQFLKKPIAQLSASLPARLRLKTRVDRDEKTLARIKSIRGDANWG